jgi:YjbE family integral membrane protein
MLLAATTALAPHTTWEWIVAVVNIVAIDVVLAGDNAVVIALAVRQLAPRQRLLGIILGAGVAVMLRVVLTYFASRLLALDYVKLVGGLLILWIGAKLLRDNSGDDHDPSVKSATGLWSAVWLIMVADITMSIDNVVAVAGASRGSGTLIWFGLGLSIPLVVFTSNLLSKLMDRYPIIVWIGAAILGKVGLEMIVTDHFVSGGRELSGWFVHGMGLAGAALVIVAGWWWRRRAAKQPDGTRPEP